MGLKTVYIFAMLISICAFQSTENQDDRCYDRCELVKEIQLLRQLVNQETMFRMEYVQQLKEMQKKLDELQNTTSSFRHQSEDDVSNIRADIQNNFKMIEKLQMDLSTQSGKLKNQSKTLWNLERKEPKDVAFHASDATLVGGDTIVFESTFLNLGGGYNNTTGEFQAPAAGLYLIIWTIVIDNKGNCDTGLYINNVLKRKNQVQGSEANEDFSGTQSIIAFLNLGDTVKIKEDTSSYQCSKLTSSYSAISGYMI